MATKGEKLSPELILKISEANRGKVRSPESRLRYSLSKLGEKHPLFGKHPSPETIEKMRIAQTGRKHSQETKEKIRNAQLGEKGPNWGRTFGPEVREKLRQAGLRRRHTPEELKKISESQMGEKNHMWGKRGKDHPTWKGGVTPLKIKLRVSPEYIQWRLKIFIRDNFTCQKCGQVSGNIEAHHIKQISILIQEAKTIMPLFDLYTACLIYAPLWDISNGVTLCKECHKKTKSYLNPTQGKR